MVAIVTRAGKGSPLTNAEVDANFVNLNNGKLETSNNLSDLADASAARTNLGLGSLATLNSITSLMVTDALGYTPVNKAGDTITGALSIQGDIGSSTGLVIYNTTTTDGRSVAEFRNDRNSVQRYLLGVDPDGGSNKAFALRDVTGGGIRLWVTTQGNVNVGPGHVNNSAVNINKLATGSATLNGFGTEQAVQSDVSTFRGYNTALATQATAFTLGSLIHYRASQGTFGAGSTVTSQNAFVADASLIGAGTNIGFRGAIPAGSNRWNLYMDGTAQNFIGGNLILDGALGIGAAGSPNFGTSGQVLTSAGPGVDPVWATPTGGVTSFNTRTGAITLTSGDVTTALGFTPYNSSNPSGYITSSSLSSYLPLSGGTLTGKLVTAAIAGSQGSNVSTLEVRNNGGTGDANLANITFHCQGQYGTSLHLRPDGYFGVGGWSATTWRWYVLLTNGDMTAAGNVIAYSDERLKRDWRDLSEDFIERLAQIKHGTYTRTDTGARQAGASAQEMQRLIPETVSVGPDEMGTLSLAYGNAAMVSAIKLAQQVVDLKERLNRLEQKVGA